VLEAKIITKELLEETLIGKTISSLSQMTTPKDRDDLISEI
jgi:hypothetical protein